MVGNNEGRRKEIMSRIRSIKPEFFFDEELAHLTAHVRLFFIGLWLQADREGRLEDRPSFLKANIFPYEDIDAEKLLDALAPKFIVRYEVAGKRYIQIRNFLKHQLPHYKEVASIIPPPSENPTLTQHQSDVDLTLIQPCTQEGSRKGAGREQEGKGRELCTEPPVKQALVATLRGIEMRFPTVGRPQESKEWALSEDKVLEYRQSYPGVDTEIALMRARQWCIDNPAKRKTARGMPSFLNRWLASEQDRGGGKNANRNTGDRRIIPGDRAAYIPGALPDCKVTKC
jgi:hypothetical protein